MTEGGLAALEQQFDGLRSTFAAFAKTDRALRYAVVFFSHAATDAARAQRMMRVARSTGIRILRAQAFRALSLARRGARTPVTLLRQLVHTVMAMLSDTAGQLPETAPARPPMPAPRLTLCTPTRGPDRSPVSALNLAGAAAA